MVVQDYLGGKPRNQIAKDRNTSTGNVSNIVDSWKKRVGIPNVDELREFVVLVRKSGMSIEECVQGFRIAQTMTRIGISVDGDDEGHHDGDGSGQNNYTDFNSFAEDVYLACKNLGIPPAIIPMWIKDLRDCIAADCTDLQSRTQDIGGHGQHGFDDYGDGGGEDSTPFALEEQKNSIADKDCGLNPTIQGYAQYPTKEGSGNLVKTSHDLSGYNSEIPFMSHISDFVSKMKKECSGLSKQKLALTKETKNLKREKEKVQGSLDRIYEKYYSVNYYLDWFYQIKEELGDRYQRKIDDIGDFANVVNDFALHGYDPCSIIKEYTRWQSVKDEIMAASSRILDYRKNEKDLKDKIDELESRQESLTQTMNAYSELVKMGLDLEELKQLVSTIMRIANANGIPNDKAADKFFRDIQEQYDNKIGFEKMADVKKTELVQTANKLAVSQACLQLQPFIGPILNDFLRIGFTFEDIKNIHLLIFRYSSCISSLNDCMINVGLKAGNAQNKLKPNWLEVLTGELKKYGDKTRQ
jgi:predicted  nucleic acid-binding Zn-ribbon protein